MADKLKVLADWLARKNVVAGWEDLPAGWTEESAKKFWKSVGGKEHLCKEKIRGTGITNPDAFCASLKDLVEGTTHWRGPGASKHRTADINEDLPRAAANGELEKVRELLDKGADVNAKDSHDRTALMEAVDWGYVDVVKLLLDRGTDPNAKDVMGKTALMRAANKGHTDIAKLLLNARADPNAKDNDGETALMKAAYYGRTGIVKLLLDAGADVNAKDSEGNTALDWATGSDYPEPEVVDLLKQHGATASRRMERGKASKHRTADADLNEGGWTMISNDLLRAATAGDLQKVKELLDQGADPNAENKYGETALHAATRNGYTDVAKFLLAVGANPNVEANDGYTALMLAARNDHTDIAKLLLDAGADVSAQDRDGHTALMIATYYNHTDIVDLLKQHGATAKRHRIADINDDLLDAVAVGDFKEVKELLDQGVDVNAKDEHGWTALIWAAAKSRTDIVKLLLDQGANPNVKNNSGNTALMMAEYYDYLEIVDLLKQHGATASRHRIEKGRRAVDINQEHSPAGKETEETRKDVEDSLHKEPLDLEQEKKIEMGRRKRAVDINDDLVDAVMYANLQRVEELLNKGADPNAKAKDGVAILMWVARSGYTGIAIELLDRGADPNVKDEYGWTVLMEAVAKGYKDIVKLLLDRGVDINAEDEDGDTAFMLAKRYYFSEIVELLKQHGATASRHRIERGRRASINEDFIDAAKLGDLQKVKELLDVGADINAKNEDGWTALMWAAYKNWDDIAKLLLDVGADPNVRSKDGWTAFTLAADIKMIELLKEHGATASRHRMERGRRAVEINQEHSPAGKETEETRKDVEDSLHKEPLDLEQEKKIEMGRRKAMIRKGYVKWDVRKVGDKVVLIGASGKPLFATRDKIASLQDVHRELVASGLRHVLKKYGFRTYDSVSGDAVVDKTNAPKRDVSNSSQDNDWDKIYPKQKDPSTVSEVDQAELDKITARRRMERGRRAVEINQEHSPAGKETEETRKDVEDSLHKEPLDLEQEKKIEMGRRHRIENRKRAVDINEDLFDAVWGNDLQKVKELLDQGADVNARDNERYTTLMMAVSYSHIDMAKLLLDKGADPNVKDKYGDTALMIAAIQGDIDIAKLLLDQGADVNTKDNDGRTALMKAKDDYPEIVELLKEHGATASRHRMERGRRAVDINQEHSPAGKETEETRKDVEKSLQKQPLTEEEEAKLEAQGKAAIMKQVNEKANKLAEEMKAGFRHKIRRALALALVRQALNLDKSGLFRLKEAMAEALYKPSRVFAGMRTDVATTLIEEAFSMSGPTAKAVINEIVSKAFELANMPDEAFIAAEEDVKSLDSASPLSVDEEEEEEGKEKTYEFTEPSEVQVKVIEEAVKKNLVPKV